MAEIRTEDIFGTDALKPNSNLSKEKKDIPEKKEKLSPVAKGKKRKKTGVRKLINAFIDENPEGIIRDDPDSIKVSIFRVLIPEAKKLVLDIVNAVMYRGGKSPYSKRTTASKISYRDYYDTKDSYQKSDIERRTGPMTARDYDDVIFDSRGEAERVLACMEEIIATCGVVTVAEFYELSEIEDDVSWTTNKFGWKSVSSARINRISSDEYSILFPKAMPLD